MTFVDELLKGDHDDLIHQFFSTLALLFKTFFAIVGASLAVTCFTILMTMLFAGIVIGTWEAATA